LNDIDLGRPILLSEPENNLNSTYFTLSFRKCYWDWL